MKLIGPLAVMMLGTLTLAGQTVEPAASDIAALIEAELKAARVPGAAIAVVARDQRVSRGYGVADADSGAPMMADTLVHVGSVTKLFTALAVTTALDALRMPLETAVGKALPGLAPRTSSTTFHALLSQSSGLRDRPGDDGEDDEAALSAQARALADADFLLPQGTVFSYSNLGYALAGAALEGLRKKSYADAMRDVFVTLDMTRATLRPAQARSSAHALGHRGPMEKLTVVRDPANDTRIWPAGYMWASAADMVPAISALMHGGRLGARQAIPSAVVTRVTRPHVPMPNVFVGGHYGYGLMIFRDRDTLIWEHGGTLPGFSSIIRIAPTHRVGFAILSNLDNAPLRRVAQNVLAKALALPDQPPPARNETRVSVEDMRPFLGRYTNRGAADLVDREGQVMLVLDDGPAFAVSRLSPNRFLARPSPTVAGPEFVLEPARGATPAYLHFALWAYVKN